MGQFSKDVRDNKIPGPNQRRFERATWTAAANNPELGDDDRAFAKAGLYFDDMLTAVRAGRALDDFPLSPEALIRMIIAVGTANMLILRKQTKGPNAPGGRGDIAFLSDVLQETVVLPSGDRFSPDEVLGAVGDALKHVLRELMKKTPASGASEYTATNEQIDHINKQLNIAILYDVGVQHWLDFVGHGYVLVRGDPGLIMRPADSQMEIARVASAYRRRNIVFHQFMRLAELWRHQFSPALRRQIRGAPIVTKVFGLERIERIELGWEGTPVLRGVFHLAERDDIVTGSYANLVDEPLPGLGSFSLRRIVDAWLLLQSLADALFDDLRPFEESVARLLTYAPRISTRVLAATLARALQCPVEEAQRLLDVFTFEAHPEQELWSQPLVRLGNDYLLVLPCVAMANLQRIADVWLRQGKIDLSRKGRDFERYCVGDLTAARVGSVLENISSVSGSIVFRPPGQPREEIDLVVVVGETVLILEAKCVLWPEEPLQYANYRDTIEEAAHQVLRKRESVARNYPAFRLCLEALGIQAPLEPDVICAILTNSAVYAGFPVRNVPVTDLLILGAFFNETVVKVEVRAAGKTMERHVIRLYGSVGEAPKALAGYLQKPLQLADTLNSVKARSVMFPYEHEALGGLVHETFLVEMDGRAVLSQRRGMVADASENPGRQQTRQH